MTGHILRAAWQFAWTFLLSVPMVLLGLPIVAFGLLFRRATTPEKPFSQFDTDRTWQRIQLPDWRWIRPWDHVVDGFYGDTRGWWHRHAVFDGGSRRFLNMWWWGAVRNSCDYWRRFMISCPIDECTITLLAGNAPEVNTNNHSRLVGVGLGWNFLLAQHRETRRRWYQLAVVWPWRAIDPATGKGRCLNIWLGWKFKMLHAAEDFSGDRDYKRWKGFEFLIHPAKAFD